MMNYVRLPAMDRPGFCQVCYCEHCGRGFYEKARDAVKFNDGRVSCSEQSCVGEVRSTPVLSWNSAWREKKCSCRTAAMAA